MSVESITLDEWYKALEEIQQRPGAKGFTSSDVSDASGCSQSLARQRIRSLILAGRAKHVGMRGSKRIDGRPTTIPVYALTKGKK
jgi:hypothetical protein